MEDAADCLMTGQPAALLCIYRDRLEREKRAGQRRKDHAEELPSPVPPVGIGSTGTAREK